MHKGNTFIAAIKVLLLTNSKGNYTFRVALKTWIHFRKVLNLRSLLCTLRWNSRGHEIYCVPNLLRDPFLSSNATPLEYSFYTCFKQFLRNVGRKPYRKVLIPFIRIRLRAIYCRSLQLKVVFSLWVLWIVFECYQVVALKDAVHYRGKGTITVGLKPLLCPSRWVFKETPKENYSKRLANRQVFSAQYCFGPSCAVRLVSGCGPKEHLAIKITLITESGTFYVNTGLHSKATNSIAWRCIITA
jgi:hypothetical protein